jgi:hypothetical protein
MESSPSRPPDGGRNGQRGPAREFRDQARNALIQSRLTPNAISMVAWQPDRRRAGPQEMFFLAGIAFVLGSVMDTLDGRYSRMSGRAPSGAFLIRPRPDRGGIVLPVPITSPNKVTRLPLPPASTWCSAR